MGGEQGNYLAADGDGGGGAFVLVASGGVVFSGTGDLGDGTGAVYGDFTNTGSSPTVVQGFNRIQIGTP